MQYKAWRSNTDKDLFVVCRRDEFENLPQRIRSLGPWQGSMEGEMERLRPQYRAQIASQGFTLIHCPLSSLKLEA
jgi:hypothetical protein